MDLPDVFTEVPGTAKGWEHKSNTHKHTHNIVVRTPICPVPLAAKPLLQQEVEKMLQLGVEESQSPWRSTPVMMPKPNGSIRVCIDFRKLNALSSVGACPMPYIDALLHKVG